MVTAELYITPASRMMWPSDTPSDAATQMAMGAADVKIGDRISRADTRPAMAGTQDALPERRPRFRAARIAAFHPGAHGLRIAVGPGVVDGRIGVLQLPQQFLVILFELRIGLRTAAARIR